MAAVQWYTTCLPHTSSLVQPWARGKENGSKMKPNYLFIDNMSILLKLLLLPSKGVVPHVYLCTMCMSGAQRSEEGVGFLELELQLWGATYALGIKPQSSRKGASALDCSYVHILKRLKVPHQVSYIQSLLQRSTIKSKEKTSSHLYNNENGDKIIFQKLSSKSLRSNKTKSQIHPWINLVKLSI